MSRIPFGLQLVLVEEIGVQVRELDRVLDLIDLVVEPADIGVGDIGHLFEDELLDLGTGSRSTSTPDRVSIKRWSPARSRSSRSAGAQLAHAFLVRAANYRRGALSVGEQLLECDDLARNVGPRASTTLSDSLSTTSWPRWSSSMSSSGCDANRIFRPAVNTSTVPSSFDGQERPDADGGMVSFSTSSRRTP